MDGLIVLHASKFHHFADGEHLTALREFKNLLQIVAIINVFRHRSSPPFQNRNAATHRCRAWRHCLPYFVVVAGGSTYAVPVLVAPGQLVTVAGVIHIVSCEFIFLQVVYSGKVFPRCNKSRAERSCAHPLALFLPGAPGSSARSNTFAGLAQNFFFFLPDHVAE